MKLKYFLLIPALVVISVLPGCKDDDDCTAGTGGSVTIVASIKHHSAAIWSQGNYRDTVMVKFNTQEFPGANPANYDLVLPGDSGEDHVHITGVTCGDYYLYAVGFDTTISQRVSGGMPFTTAATSGEVPVTVQVTE